MSDLQRSGGRRPTRKQREQRAYALVMTAGTLGVITVISFVLAVLGVASSIGLTFLLLVLTVAAGFLAKRTVT